MFSFSVPRQKKFWKSGICFPESISSAQNTAVMALSSYKVLYTSSDQSPGVEKISLKIDI